MKKSMNEYELTGEYYGADKYEGEYRGHHAVVCIPKNCKRDAPFVYRTEFFGAFDAPDGEMIRRGYAVVSYSISNLFGSDGAVELMYGFFRHVTKAFSLFPKCFLFGLSRGGLYAANFAALHPDCTAGLYLDAPVLTLSAWPFGLGRGEKSEADTLLAYEVMGLDDSTAPHFDKNPLDRLPKLLEHHIPVVLVAGLADTVVPYEESGGILERAYRRVGERMEVMLKPRCGHHPHGLEDPAPICDALEAFLFPND